MEIGYFDCFSGASGNMILGALIDAGLDKNFLIQELKKIPLEGWRISVDQVKRAGFGATYVDIKIKKNQPKRGLKEIKKNILKSRLEKDVQNKIIKIFLTLAKAESKVHRIPVAKVHFHEIGAVDTILDIAGAVIGFKKLGLEKIYCSALNLGSGLVKTEHGVLPVPAPATAEILKGVPTFQNEIKFELTTPTAAAILKTLAAGFGPMPEMKIEKIGLGAGTKNFAEHPNILRLFIGESLPKEAQDILIEFNLDDASSQIFETLFEKVFQAGAWDIYLTPIQMKKNRPAFKVNIIAPEKNLEKIAEIVFAETPTFGLRWWPIGRIKLDRKFETVKTPLGKVKFKIGSYKNKVMTAAPEYEDLKKIAEEKKLPFRKVREIVLKSSL